MLCFAVFYVFSAASFLPPYNGRVDDDVLLCLFVCSFGCVCILPLPSSVVHCVPAVVPPFTTAEFQLALFNALCCGMPCATECIVLWNTSTKKQLCSFRSHSRLFHSMARPFNAFALKGAHRQDSQLCAGHPQTAHMNGSSLFAIGMLTNSSHTLRFCGSVH